jgi:hypothetical protein
LGKRYEPRAPAGLQVKVYGIDASGNPFKQTARAHNVSRRGACLVGIGCLGGPGVTIEVEHCGKKAKFTVAWVGLPGTPEQNRIGVRNSDHLDIWKLDLPKPQPDNFKPPDSETGWEGHAIKPHELQTKSSVGQPLVLDQRKEFGERRRYRRYAINGSATLQVKGTDVRTWAKLTDVSPGGCYVESYAPFPAGTELLMTLEVGEVRVTAEGIVKVVYTGLGMGIEFTKIGNEDRRQLERLTAQPAKDIC